MTAPDIAAIEARLAAATPVPRFCPAMWSGVWRCAGGAETYLYGGTPGQPGGWRLTGKTCGQCQGAAAIMASHRNEVAALNAHAPSDLAALLAEVERLSAALEYAEFQAAERMTADDLHDKAIGVAVLAPGIRDHVLLTGDVKGGYLTPYKTVQDAEHGMWRTGDDSRICLLIPVDQDGGVL